MLRRRRRKPTITKTLMKRMALSKTTIKMPEVNPMLMLLGTAKTLVPEMHETTKVRIHHNESMYLQSKYRLRNRNAATM